MNLASIYRDLGKTDEALTDTIKAIECDQDNIEVLQNLQSLASNIKVNSFNRNSAGKAYEKLLNCDDFSHRKIGHLFIQHHLEDIQAAASSNPIISEQSQVLHRLASDWRFRTALTTDPTPPGDRGITHTPKKAIPGTHQNPQLHITRA